MSKDGFFLVGTSGWSYKEWIGPFYPSEKNQLPFYSSIFSTAEINSTFYALPPRWLPFSWLKGTKPGFVFSAKVPRSITHKKKLESVGRDLEEFLGLMDPLRKKGKLGVLLIQLPPKLGFNVEILRKFLETLPSDFKFAVEFRNKSWLRGETYKLLDTFNVAYTVVDEPLIPPEIVVTSDFSYVRFHGRGERPWYNYHYSLEELREWVPKLREIGEKVEKVYVYFNNHFKGYAVKNSLEFMELLGLKLKGKAAEAKGKLEKWILKGEIEAIPEPLIKVEALTQEAPFENLVKALTGPRRFERAGKIPADKIKFSLTNEKRFIGRVKDYRVEINLHEKTIAHDCSDWGKTAVKKQFCKHLAAFFLSMDRLRAREILQDILKNRDKWLFKPVQSE